MKISRREFLYVMACVVGSWTVGLPGSNPVKSMARLLRYPKAGTVLGIPAEDSTDRQQDVKDEASPVASATPKAGDPTNRIAAGQITDQEAEKILAEAGRFNELTAERFVFDENKYSPLKRQLPKSEWSAVNRHLPIQVSPDVINSPGERSPEALIRVVDYTQFDHPRYVAQPGERVTMCNIAAWDWSRALRVHIPHWIGETEMSANMLSRWISHPQAGGIYGEGWQPVEGQVAQLLANRGVPVFALAENRGRADTATWRWFIQIPQSRAPPTARCTRILPLLKTADQEPPTASTICATPFGG